ncbi:MAG: DUF3592 domain-containing protein [Nocardioidaceae bacterium]
MGPVQVFGVVAFLIGLVLLVFTVQLFRTEAARRRRGVQVPGVVLGGRFRTTIQQSTSGPSGHFYPDVQFTTREGSVRRFTDSFGTNIRPVPGQEVTVWYDPDDHEAMPVIMGTARRLLLPGIFGLMGLVFLCVGVGIGIATVMGAAQ